MKNITVLKNFIIYCLIGFVIGTIFSQAALHLTDENHTIKNTMIDITTSFVICCFLFLTCFCISHMTYNISMWFYSKFKKKRLNKCRMCEMVPNVPKKYMKEAIGEDGLCVKCHLYLCMNPQCDRCKKIQDEFFLNPFIKQKMTRLKNNDFLH